MINTLTLLLVALSLSCCTGQRMESIPSSSVVKRPGETLSLSCRGSGFTFSCCGMNWIRQPAGKGLEWIGAIWSDASGTAYSSSVQGRIEISRDNSNSMTYLRLSNLQPEDSAVYYCARYGAAFDYWGRGTEVTVTSATPTLPKVFPLVSCKSATENEVTLGCLAYGFYPKSATFMWTNASGTKLDSHQYISYPSNNNTYTGVSVITVSESDSSAYKCSVNHPEGNRSVTVKRVFSPEVTLLSVPSEDKQALVCTIEKLSSETLSVSWKKNGVSETGFMDGKSKKTGDVYSTVSVLKVTKADWDSNAVYTCEVTHDGLTYTKTISKAPITVTLNPPSPKDIFSNNQAVLECVVTGEDSDVLSKTTITWQIDGQPATENITSDSQAKRKSSKLTLTLTAWAGVSKVRCSAKTKDMTPVIEDLTVHKGDGTEPKVTVHILPEQDINQEVTLVCLVSSSMLQDYYITWTEDNGQTTGIYTNGINFPPQKTKNGYSVTSLYATTKKKWNDGYMIKCHVWPAGRKDKVKPHGVSKDMDIPLEFLSSTEGSTDEDELSSLWFTSSCFIFLFIFSLFYNMIFSLVKMKKQ